MPWKVVKDEPRCIARSKSKRWGVVAKTDNSLAGCHATESGAKQQLAALYANEGKTAKGLFNKVKRLHP